MVSFTTLKDSSKTMGPEAKEETVGFAENKMFGDLAKIYDMSHT